MQIYRTYNFIFNYIFGAMKTLTLDFLGVDFENGSNTIGSLITQTNMLINSHIHLGKFVEVDKIN